MHIGFGKCGTTSLQRHVFSHLVDMGLVDSYNPIDIKDSLGQFRRGDQTQVAVLRHFFDSHHDQKTLVSLESLIGWNPAIWQERLAMNRAAFPEETIVLMTIREPEGFLRSFYQQNLHQGHVVPPEHYLLSRTDYARARLTAREQIAEVFSVDDLHFRQIVADYAAAFSKVVVVPVSAINDVGFLDDLGLSAAPAQITRLQHNIRNGAKENRAFSRTAMRLTNARERLLNGFRLKSLSSNDHDYRIRFLPPPANLPPLSLPRRILRRLGAALKPPGWRWAMHRLVDRFWPYTPYTLPPHVPRGVHFADNKAFVESITRQPQGFGVYTR